MDNAAYSIYIAPRFAGSVRNALVKVLESGGQINGVGETGVPPVAPALANAIFHATGNAFANCPCAKHIDFGWRRAQHHWFAQFMKCNNRATVPITCRSPQSEVIAGRV
jgi:hypothetical protein